MPPEALSGTLFDFRTAVAGGLFLGPRPEPPEVDPAIVVEARVSPDGFVP